MAREGRSGGLGVGLLTLSLVVLFVAWPPPAAGVEPLLGYGSVLLAVPAGLAALLLALLGGLVVGRRASRGAGLGRRAVAGVVAAVVPVGLEALYLVEVIGFGTRGSVLLYAVAVAALVGVAAEVPR